MLSFLKWCQENTCLNMSCPCNTWRCSKRHPHSSEFFHELGVFDRLIKLHSWPKLSETSVNFVLAKWFEPSYFELNTIVLNLVCFLNSLYIKISSFNSLCWNNKLRWIERLSFAAPWSRQWGVACTISCMYLTCNESSDNLITFMVTQVGLHRVYHTIW